MIQKSIDLSENYDDMMNFIAEKLAEPITKQYLETCLSNATYNKYTSVESLVDAINFYFDSKTLKDVYIMHNFLHHMLMNQKMHHTRKLFQFLLHIFPPLSRKQQHF